MRRVHLSHRAIPKLSVHDQDERSDSENERDHAKCERHEHCSPLTDPGTVTRIVVAPFSIGERRAATHLLAAYRWRCSDGMHSYGDRSQNEPTDESNGGYGKQHSG